LSAKSLKLLHPDSFPKRQLCQKCVCGRGFALDPTGQLTGLPIPLAGFKGPTSKGRGGQAEQGWERKGRERERKGQGRERGKWRERGIPALLFPHFEP